jgi:hypothetical protein
MNFRLVLLCALLCPLILAAQGFDKSRLEGSWYLLNKGGFTRMSFHNDTIASERLNFDLSTKNKVPQRFHIEKVVEQNKNIYIFAKQLDSTARIKITTITGFTEGKQFTLAINGINKAFTDLSKAEVLLNKDTTEKFGYTCYSQAELERFRKLKPVSEMKKGDFLAFAKEFYEEKAKNKAAVENKFGSAGVTVYETQLRAKTLVKNGYSPVLSLGEYEKVEENYRDDKEVQAAIGKYLSE